MDNNVADSACSGTAYMTGVKANSGTVGVSAAVKRGDCAGQLDDANVVKGLTAWAQAAGKATGDVQSLSHIFIYVKKSLCQRLNRLIQSKILMGLTSSFFLRPI